MYYSACDSPRGFIEADMGLVGLLWGRTTCTCTKPNNQKTTPYFCHVSSEDRGSDVVSSM